MIPVMPVLLFCPYIHGNQANEVIADMDFPLSLAALVSVDKMGGADEICEGSVLGVPVSLKRINTDIACRIEFSGKHHLQKTINSV